MHYEYPDQCRIELWSHYASKYSWQCHDSSKLFEHFTISKGDGIDIPKQQDDIYICPRICQEFVRFFFFDRSQSAPQISIVRLRLYCQA